MKQKCATVCSWHSAGRMRKRRRLINGSLPWARYALLSILFSKGKRKGAPQSRDNGRNFGSIARNMLLFPVFLATQHWTTLHSCLLSVTFWLFRLKGVAAHQWTLERTLWGSAEKERIDRGRWRRTCDYLVDCVLFFLMLCLSLFYIYLLPPCHQCPLVVFCWSVVCSGRKDIESLLEEVKQITNSSSSRSRVNQEQLGRKGEGKRGNTRTVLIFSVQTK